MAAAAQIYLPIETFSLSFFGIQTIQAKLNRLITQGLIPSFPILETGRVDTATTVALQAFCEVFAIDSTVELLPGMMLSKPRKVNVPPPLMSRFSTPTFANFNLAGAEGASIRSDAAPCAEFDGDEPLAVAR
jgi:hypothetical protein